MKKSFGSINSNASAPVASEPTINVVSKESELAKREGILEERERLLAEKLQLSSEKIDQLEKLRKDLVSKLENSAEMSREEAKKVLLENLEHELASEISKKIRESEDEIKLIADEKAKEILADAMLHGVTDYISEFTTSRIQLPDEEMKGRIIGREGRNVKSFEQATGVDVVMDEESPNTLTLSSFDPVRREIAKISLERLIADGRIQPQRIEEIVQKSQEDVEKLMCQAGEKLCHDVEVFNMPREAMCTLGRFKYRYSYGQNMIQHTLEETRIGVELARELGADVNIVRLGCLLHDIAKPQEVEHFFAVVWIICYVAGGLSGARPAARHENVQDYIKRLKDIERIATSFDAVEKAFAVQAGREVRVIVTPDKISDDDLPKLVHDIGEQIQREVMVPGAVKITAIRESRYSDSF